MPGPAWIVLPTYNEAENLERDGRDALRAGAAAPTRDPGRRRRLARRHRRDRRPARRGGPATSRSCTAPARRGSGRPTSPASRTRSRAARARWSRWTPTSPTTPRTVPALLGRARRRRRPRARLALRRRRRGGELGARWRRAVSRGGCAVRAARAAACPCATSPAASSASAREVLRGDRLPDGARAGYAFQVELTYRALRAGLRVVELPIVVPRAARGRVEDVGRDRARGGLARAGAAPPVPPPAVPIARR